MTHTVVLPNDSHPSGRRKQPNQTKNDAWIRKIREK